VSNPEGPASAGPFMVTSNIPEYEPHWHWKIYRKSSHAFPTLHAAKLFAQCLHGQWPTATITIMEV